MTIPALIATAKAVAAGNTGYSGLIMLFVLFILPAFILGLILLFKYLSKKIDKKV